MKDQISQFEMALLDFNEVQAKEILIKVLANGRNVIADVIENALKSIGDKWEKGDVALSQVYISGRICESLVTELLPVSDQDSAGGPETAIVTYGDYHILGKKIIYAVLKSSGINLLDLGHGLNADEIVEEIINKNIRILLVSVLMYPSALEIKELRGKLNDHHLDVRLIVGGAPFYFDNNLWKQVGADAMGKSPADAISLINDLTY